MVGGAAAIVSLAAGVAIFLDRYSGTGRFRVVMGALAVPILTSFPSLLLASVELGRVRKGRSPFASRRWALAGVAVSAVAIALLALVTLGPVALLLLTAR